MRQHIILPFLILLSCSSNKPEQNKEVNQEKMIQTIKQMTFSSYTDMWQKVQDFENKGLTQSAYETVKVIYEQAHKDNNMPQIIKSLLYQSKYMMSLEEDSELKIVQRFEKEIAKAKVPEKNILESYLAQMFWQYYRSNRYKFAKRTETAVKVDTNDFRTWDLKTLFKEVNQHFNRSLQNPVVLQNLPLKQWQDVLDFNKKSQKYQPALYDVLVQEALSFYQTDEHTLTAPAYKFTIDHSEYLSDVQQFVNLNIQSDDSLSLQFKALRLYQSYLKQRLKDQSHLDALAYADLQRLKFIYNNAVFSKKEQIYLDALKHFVQTYQKSDVAALGLYEQAIILNELGNSYNYKTNKEVRWYKKQAFEICERAIQKYPKSRGADLCLKLSAQIKQISLSVDAEKNIPEHKPALVKLTYKNVSNVFLKLYKAGHSQIDALQHIYNQAEKRRFIEQLPLHKTINITLQNDGDFQIHSTEYILEGLSNGEYIAYLTVPDSGQETFAYNVFQVTDVALQSIAKTLKQNEFLVYNRSNGKVYSNVKINIKKQTQNHPWQNYKQTKTNVKGKFTFYKQDRYYDTYLFEISYEKGKKAFFQDYLPSSFHENEHFSFQTAFIFTDRSIYRPGQTLYFKSICLTKMRNSSKVMSHQNLEVTLYDANRQKVTSKTLTTNDYGSINGEFILPEQTLTGLFTLEVRKKYNQLLNSKTIRVEAYKRPKFEVVLNKPEKTYKVNDMVSVKGQAQSFAGTNITDAKVIYRVKREVIMPRWWFWYRPAYTAESQEITHGETQTDADGNFVIQFKAVPDLSVKPENHPVFHYVVYAEVTDINGETHQVTSGVKVGYQQLLVNLEMSNRLNKNNTDTIFVKTTNLNDVKVPAQGELMVYKLKAPNRVLRTRPWTDPDVQKIDRSQFEKLFPHMPYTHEETNPVFWEQEEVVFKTNFDTGKQEKIPFKVKSTWQSGKYLVVLHTKDKDKNEITDKQVVDIYSPVEKTIVDNQFLSIDFNKKEYHPGDVLRLKIGSAGIGNIIRVWVEKGHQIIMQKSFKTDGTFKTLSVPVSQKDIGGFAVHYTYTAYNDYKKVSKVINVPYPTKELEIETLTFRDKLKPGQQEEWRFKIKGKKAEKITAEVLASMYDMSLDQFVTHQWSFNPINYVYYQPFLHIKSVDAYGQVHLFLPVHNSYIYNGDRYVRLSRLNWYGFRFGNYKNRYIYLQGVLPRRNFSKAIHDNITPTVQVSEAEEPVAEADMSENLEEVAVKESSVSNSNDDTKTANVSVRSNFNETAFFYPNLYTDKQGNVSFGFTAPESLTKWKLQLLAHTKDLSYGYQKLTAQTQKDLMVFPNAPRFVREGDVLVFSTKISNLTDENLQGAATIQLFDAVKQKDVTNQLIAANAQQSFNVNVKGNTEVSWMIKVPKNLEALQYKIIAKAGNQSDGEQNLMPVLSNRMLVTETLPMWVRSGQTKTFTLDKLLHNQSATLKNHRLTLEITSNPAWYAVQAMPYLMEYPYECSEQTFSRYYANTLAAHIVHQNPKIKQVFDVWKNYNSDALLSNLEKNQELKSIIIEETPWLRDAQSETEQKKRIALLFDLNKMSYAQKTALNKLSQMQLSDGGFTWFKGGRYSNRYITRHIVAGFGHLRQLGVDVLADNNTRMMIRRAINFLDNQIYNDYQELLKHQEAKKDFLEKYHPGVTQIHYLYARSFYPEVKIPDNIQTAVDYYRQQGQKYWLSYDLYTQGLIALMSHRHGEASIAKAIIRSLDENSIKSEELGMYWKNNIRSWYWYQAPIETQALLIEAFDAIDGDVKKLDEMRIWLLKHKQTNAWKTTKQTTEAVYALLLRRSDWLSLTDNVSVQVGNIKIDPATMPEIKTEAGTGYFKKSWMEEQITPDMAKVTIHKKDKGIAWGALYWQYFENLDKITNAKTPVAITKELFIRRFTDTGEKIEKITPDTKIKLGELVRVRVEIKVDRPMEYVHLKDMRAAGFEPVNVLSGYRWQDGLGYYEATSDAATNFFIGRLPKGVYVFEYDLRANNAGSYSNGITTLQCMYAPEFTSHSKGQHIEIVKN